MKIKLVMVETWNSLPDKIADCKVRVLEAKNALIEIESVVVSLPPIQWVPFDSSFPGAGSRIGFDWQKLNLEQYRGNADLVMLVLPQRLWGGGNIAGYTNSVQGKWYTFILAEENWMWPQIPTMGYFTNNCLHETTHYLYSSNSIPDSTHLYLWQDKFDLKGALTNIPMNQARVVKSKNNSTVWICEPVPDMDYLNKKANLEGFTVPTTIPNTDTL
jgi:hypothetical protein